MRRIIWIVIAFQSFSLYGQNKKPLDHSVYDNWQSIGEHKISRDGKWILYSVDVQEGDNTMVLQSADGKYKETIPRGYQAAFTEDGKYMVCKIKPPFQAQREAKIKKKAAKDFPKDSLVILEPGKGIVLKEARVKSYKLPEKNGGWIAWLLEEPLPDSVSGSKEKTALMSAIESAKRSREETTPEQMKQRQKIEQPRSIYEGADEDDALAKMDRGRQWQDTATKKEKGTKLVIYNLQERSVQKLENVKEYLWSKTANILVAETTLSEDSLQKPAVFVYRTGERRWGTILNGGNSFKQFAIDEEGYRVAFIAERDSGVNAQQRFYKLWYWQNGYDTAQIVADKNTVGMPVGWSISENAKVYFSKSGKRLFAGTAPVQPPKDTSLVDIDLVKVDVWNYKDDYLQTMQLKNLDKDLKKYYLAMINLTSGDFIQLADEKIPEVVPGKEGDGDFFVGITDVGKRIPMQWEGRTLKDIYVINPLNGSRKRIKENLSAGAGISPGGQYAFWYDPKLRQYFTWKDGKTRDISSRVKVKWHDEEFDMPTDPTAYGVMGWTEDDKSILLYDRYDIWQLSPEGAGAATNLTLGLGRKNKVVYRYIKTDPEERFIASDRQVLLHQFSEQNKNSGFAALSLHKPSQPGSLLYGAFAVSGVNLLKAKNSDVYIYTRETYVSPPDLYVNIHWKDEKKLSSINPQQSEYNWGTAELFHWKAYNGKMATGIVYKPEDFNPKKKYPAICYFYERLSDGLNQYIPPTPTPSRLNISFFVSRGYVVFVPDIEYTIGHPGKSAYNYIVSGARALVKKGWVDSTRMGLQGQSWGGYQTAYVITQTKLFKAAWAGAPVSNMTSAYGGIRWATGLNRQFQYEKTQSRIGAALWDKPQLYIENSPLFHLPKVNTPLVIMHNDNDGAVPWYQGIELFTGLRRLGKPVWLLNYNGEEHNLMQRKNRKDIQIREQQFFDWLLKGERPPRWLSEGIPATMKGKIWGLE